MAGATITLDLEIGNVAQALARLSRFNRDGLPAALDDIGENLVKSTRDRAADEVDPEGEPWAALSPRYKRSKTKKRAAAKTLIFDFHLLGDELSHQVAGDELFVGTNAGYGAIQQFGGATDMAPGAAGIPARPYLGISDADELTILDIVEEHLLRAFDAPYRR